MGEVRGGEGGAQDRQKWKDPSASATIEMGVNPVEKKTIV